MVRILLFNILCKICCWRGNCFLIPLLVVNGFNLVILFFWLLLIQSACFAGTRFQGTTLSTSSFICQDILPSGYLHAEKYGASDWCRRIKVEDGSDYRPLSSFPVTNGHHRSKSLFPPFEIEKQFPPFHESGANTATGSLFGDNSGQYPHDLGVPNSGSRSYFHNTTVGSEEFNLFNTATAIQGFSGISGSGCALSLLSSQSHNSSSHASEIPMARPLVMPGNHTCYSISQASEKITGSCSQASMNTASNKLPSSGMNPVDGNHHLNPILISNAGDALNFDITDGIFEGTGFVNSKGRLSCDNGPTIDLLQLSSQLQRVEDQRQTMQTKHENDAFCCLRIT